MQEIRDNGWNIFSSPRAERAGGGIGILYRDGTTSDHHLVLAELWINKSSGDYTSREQVEMYRNFKGVDVEMFRCALQTVGWTEILNSDCPERALEIYVSMMDDFVEGKKDKPWRNKPEVLKILRERRRAERAWEKNKTPLTKKQFNELKRQFGRVDKGARIKYVRDDLEASKEDPGGPSEKA